MTTRRSDRSRDEGRERNVGREQGMDGWTDKF